VYFILFSLSNQIFGGLFPIPKVDIPDLGTLWPLRQLTRPKVKKRGIVENHQV
jgi:hypothetical protein